ncbi:MAG: anti-sigma factor, partial [Acidobacteriota bacterium]
QVLSQVDALTADAAAPRAAGPAQPPKSAARPPAADNVVRFDRSAPAQTQSSAGGWTGWVAAAAIALAALALWPRAEAVLSPSERKATLVAESTDLITLDWATTEDPAALSASGSVVWSTDLQAGFMTFRGLPVNDPDVEQYQLWIFDVEQDEQFPVDGGVFDITGDGEVVVEIDPKLRIQQPTLFAITIEKPGGVVVSSRARLPLLAQVG